MTTPVETYNLQDLGFLTYYAPKIATVANSLGGLSSFSIVDLGLIIAAPLVEEFHDRYETSLKTAIQYGADVLIKALSEQKLQESFALISSGAIVLPQEPSIFQKLVNPIVIDVGMGNIQLYTAVNLLNDYIAANPSADPLGIT